MFKYNSHVHQVNLSWDQLQLKCRQKLPPALLIDKSLFYWYAYYTILMLLLRIRPNHARIIILLWLEVIAALLNAQLIFAFQDVTQQSDCGVIALINSVMERIRQKPAMIIQLYLHFLEQHMAHFQRAEPYTQSHFIPSLAFPLVTLPAWRLHVFWSIDVATLNLWLKVSFHFCSWCLLITDDPFVAM